MTRWREFVVWLPAYLLRVVGVLLVLVAITLWSEAHAEGVCDGWNVTDTTTPFEFAPNQFPGNPDICAAAASQAQGWGGTISNCTATLYQASWTYTSGGVNSAFVATRYGCTPDAPGGDVAFVAEVPNPAPRSVLVPLLAAFLAFLWWMVFR